MDSPLPTALLVERSCSVNSSSHGQDPSNGRDSLREVLIRISAETADGALLSPSSSSSPSRGDGDCSPSPGKARYRRKRPWPWSNFGSGSPLYARNAVNTREGSSCDGPASGDNSGGGVSGDPLRSVRAEDRLMASAETHRRQTNGKFFDDPGGVAPVNRSSSTDDDDIKAREERVHNPSGTDGSSSGPVRPDQASDTAYDEGESSGLLHWPIRNEAIHIGERESPHRFRGDKEASDGQGGINNRGNGPARHHGEDNGEEGGVARGTRPLRQMVRVVVHEVLSEDFGLFTWPSGVVLACLVWARRREFRGTSVVEIGAGTALPGLLAAKLGAAVALTDREGAPWVLENIRGAVAANGLAPDDATPPISASASAAAGARGARAADVFVHGDLHDAASMIEGPRVEGGESTRKGNEEGRRREEAAGHTSKIPKGTCSVQGLSWGSVGPAMIKQAKEQWCPQVVLGADVFYSSEHFDSVLATAYMLLSASSAASAAQNASGGGGRGVESAGTPTAADVTSSPVPRGVDDGSYAAAAADHATTPRVTTPASAAGGATPARTSVSSAGPTDVTTASLGSPFDKSKCVFLTAYQERSARRSLRPLLRKWGMRARVLHDAPQQVLPPALWESGRYDSVALLEITLL